MALVHEFEKTGNWLFVRRSWLPLFFVAAGFGVIYFYKKSSIAFDFTPEMIFLLISLLGELIRIITVGHAPRNTSGRNTSEGQVADVINTSGIYSIIRHPLYVGNLLMWLGPVLFIRSGWFTMLFLLSYWIYYERIMFAEEQFLRKKFGKAYDKWSASVPAVIPKSFKYVKPVLPFSVKTVLHREYNSFFNVFLIFLVLDVFRNFTMTGGFLVTPVWLWMFCGVFIFWLVVRIIWKQTYLLKVDGR